MKCSLCDDNAIAVYSLPKGCIAYPELKIQALCAQHIVKAQPRSGMVLLEDLTLEKLVLRKIWPK
jgi:hypothetical protein